MEVASAAVEKFNCVQHTHCTSQTFDHFNLENLSIFKVTTSMVDPINDDWLNNGTT